MISGVSRHYETLGLGPGASLEEVRRAYRQLVQVWHPDRFTHNPELQHKAQERLKEINESYNRLSSYRSRRNFEPALRKRPVEKKAAARRYANTPRKESFRRQGKKVLVVEQEPGFRRSLKDFLIRKGFQVVEAIDGDEAVSVFVKDRPKLVFVGSPVQGRERATTVRRLKTINPEATVFLATGHDLHQLREATAPEGALYLSKPINFSYLELAIGKEPGSNGDIVDLTV